MNVITQAIADLLGWSAGKFYTIERLGPPLPAGPVLVVANHPNVFLDAFVVLRAGGRAARPLVQASHFENPLYRPVLAGLGALPVHRPQGNPALALENEDMFRAAVAALRAGGAVQIYPEGRSHSEPSLAPLRTGAARIALRAEAEAGWRLGLQLVPVGLTYARKPLFRGRALAAMGEPLTLESYRGRYEADPVSAARALTEEVAARLEAVTLNLAEVEDLDLIDTAERLYSREKGWAGWREREGLAERLPRLQAFARGLAALRARDPDRHRRLAGRVRRYRRLVERLGAVEGEIPPDYPASAVAAFILREGAFLALGLPVALAGIVAWYLPYRVPWLVARVAAPASQAVATFKLAAALAVFPTWLVLLAALVGWRLGAGAAAGAALLLPLLGLFALEWTSRWGRVREDARLYARLALRPRHRVRLAEIRASLAEEFDRAMAGGRGSRRAASG